MRHDPYINYQKLRDQFPVCWSDHGFWLAYRHAEVSGLLTDPRCDHWDIGAATQSQSSRAQVMADCLQRLSLKPPAQLRATTLKVLSGTALHTLQQKLTARANQLLDGLAPAAEFDVIADFANPFTFAATCEVLGVPAAAVAPLRHCVNELRGEILQMLPLPPAGQKRSLFEATFAGAIHATLVYRRTKRGADLTSAIWDATELGDDMTPAVMANLLVFLFYASHKNIMTFIGNAVNALLQYPDQATLLRQQPSLASTSFGELLRYDGPVHYVRVTPREALTLGGQHIEAGETVFACLASANRDDTVFADPTQLKLTRQHHAQLGFGRGALQCIGAALAKIEGAVAINALLSRFPGLQASRTPPQLASFPFVLRGFASLPVAPGSD